MQFPAVPEPPTVDLGGRWVGYSIQPGGGYGVEVFQDRETPVIFELIQTKDRVEDTQRSSDVFGVESALAEVEGVVSGDDLFIRGTRFVGDPGNYCLISAVLRHQQDAMGERLTGEFVRSSEPAACDAWVRGHLVLERGRPGERARR